MRKFKVFYLIILLITFIFGIINTIAQEIIFRFYVMIPLYLTILIFSIVDLVITFRKKPKQ